jgi:hypothetical protein
MNRTYLAVIAAVVLGATAAPALAHDANHPPAANFTWSPVTPRSGDAIAFAATTSDPDRDAVTVRWDLDGNGTFETAGATATRTLARGNHVVALQATDARGASVVVRKTVTVANAAPSASFDWVADGNDVTLTAIAGDPENDALTYRWDADGDGTFELTGATTTVTLPRGDHRVALKVTDALGASVTVTRALTIDDAPPAGDFTSTPSPVTGDTVDLTGVGVGDPDGDAVTEAWDLDDDGIFDAQGDTAQTSFPTPGPHTVALRLSDPSGDSIVVRHTLTIGNRPPMADFTVTPGDPVTLTSSSSDPDGGSMQLSQAWDLDGDGEFDDATGPVVARAFPVGATVVRLRVTDGDGASAVAEHTVSVAAPALPALPATPTADPVRIAAPSATPAASVLRPMAPFPVVRMRGRLTRRGVHVQLLQVTAPARARVGITCRGGGCPSARRPITLRAMRRDLRAGAVLTVRVTAPGVIGKFVRFTIRRGRPWRRTDGCLTPGGRTTSCA